MFHVLPRDVAKASLSEYARMRDYYRLVSGWKPPDKGDVVIEHTGVKIEEGAIVVD